jgi:hypothetical protein
MIKSQWPKNLEEAVNTCLLILTDQEKALIKFTPLESLVWLDYDWAMNMPNEFGMREGNTGLLESCGESDPDRASMVIVEAVWQELNRQYQLPTI